MLAYRSVDIISYLRGAFQRRRGLQSVRGGYTNDELFAHTRTDMCKRKVRYAPASRVTFIAMQLYQT